MSLAAQVSQAINSAKIGLGDLVVPAVLHSNGGRAYVNGSYINNSINTDISVVLDKFDFMEMQAADFSQSDLKINIFNPLNILNVTVSDSITLHGVKYAVSKVTKSYVGVLVPVITAYLRK